VTPPLTPERQALADAIAAVTERNKWIAEIASALSTATAAPGDARRRHEAAEVAVETARRAVAIHLIDVAAGHAGISPVTVREARSAVLDAAYELEATHDAVAALETDLANVSGVGLASPGT
jgi:hypothetical protein